MTKKDLLYLLGIGVVIVCSWKIYEFNNAKRRAEIASLPPLERGKALLKEEGCTSCHEPGNAFRAPILEKLFESKVQLKNGTTVVANREYIIRSIMNPTAEIVFGYQGVMPAYRDRFTDEELDAFIEAMK